MSRSCPMSLGNNRLSARACALFSLSILALSAAATTAAAAPLAAELGPQVALVTPRDGYVGRLSVAPLHAPIGTPVTVTGQGFPPEQSLDLAWRTVTGSWKAGDGVYLGRDFEPVAYRIAQVKTDKAGNFTTTFVTPEDFGFEHDIVVQQGNRLLTQAGF